jgi:hypothetical protein
MPSTCAFEWAPKSNAPAGVHDPYRGTPDNDDMRVARGRGHAALAVIDAEFSQEASTGSREVVAKPKVRRGLVPVLFTLGLEG